jgi:hypothetical protein
VLKKQELLDTPSYLAGKAFFDEIAKHDQEVLVFQGR